MKEVRIYLTPEEHSALHKLPKTEVPSYTTYIFWCGILALRGLKLPHSIFNIPEYLHSGEFKYVIFN